LKAAMRVAWSAISPAMATTSDVEDADAVDVLDDALVCKDVGGEGLEADGVALGEVAPGGRNFLALEERVEAGVAVEGARVGSRTRSAQASRVVRARPA
jgi:hypothetical protein